MRNIKTLKSFFNKHYYGLCLFAFMLIYTAVVPGDCKPWIVDDMSYSFYAVDFSVGFCSRILPGAILNFFSDTINITIASIYLNVVLISTFAIICYLAEKFVMGTDTKYRHYAIIILLFFLTGPCTFAMHIKTVGIIDSFWVFAAAIAFLCLQKKQLYFLIAPLSVFMVFVYYPSLLCYIPFLAIILLYKASITTEKKEKNYLLIVFFASVILSLAFAFYFVIFERSNLNYTLDEFHNFLINRGVKPGYFMYYDYAFYRYTEAFATGNEIALPSLETSDSPLLALKVILQQIATTFILIDFSHITPIALCLIAPILIYIFRFLVIQIRNNKGNKLKAFSMFCMMLLFPATILLGVCFSTDVIKWISNAFLPLFASFIYVLHKENLNAWEVFHKDFSSINTKFLIPYFFVYSLTLFFPDRG